MTTSYLSLDHIIPALAQGGLVLVPNNRLRNHLQRAYALQMTESAWKKPQIYSLSEWIARLWSQLQAQAYAPSCVKIASNLQRQVLWEKIISTSPVGAALLRPQALAVQADAARQTLELWQIDDPEFESHLPNFSLASQRGSRPVLLDTSQNAALFYQWLTEFRRLLQKSGAVTRETSFDQIARALHEKVILQSNPIFLEGFDDLPPLLLHLLESTGAKITRLPDQHRPAPQIHRTQAANTDDEIRAAALWAKSLLSQTEQPEPNCGENLGVNEPSVGVKPLIGADPFIGIAVPNLGQCRQKVERIFAEVFEPQSIMPQVARYTLPFNFSAGVPLGSTPIIQDFFAILNLRQKEIPLDDACRLLSSPFWATQKNSTPSESLESHGLKILTSIDTRLRIETITALRKLEHLHVNLSDIVYCAHKIETKINTTTPTSFSDENRISTVFEDLNNFLREKKFTTQNAAAWLAYFDDCAAKLNWPGNRRLDSQEFQQLNQFQSVRDEFAQLQEKLTAQEAISYLKFLLDRIPFQAQTPDSPIQILGALEAAGLQFSHLWVLGLSDNQWPAPAAPNPLLPIGLQTKHKMPHSNAARELAIAQQLTERYKKSADKIIFSSAHQNLENKSDAELTLRPSALIRDIALTPIDTIVDKIQSPLQDYYQNLFEQKNSESLPDNSAPALDPSEMIRGGARLLEDQANCPLVAFVRWRLGAENPNAPQYGFSAMERGNLLHACLAGVWAVLKNSQQLNDLAENQLHELVFEYAYKAVKNAQRKNIRHIGNRYADLETQRLTRLVKEWLAIEKERPAFQVVAIEEEREILLNKITLKLRLDRIDEFSNGEQMIVDYKTGSVNLKQVLDQRLTQPQLALYAIANQSNTNNPTRAVAFAKISRGDQKYMGVGQLTGDTAQQIGIQISSDWSAQLASWRENLMALAQEFCEGNAELRFYTKDAERYSEDLKPLLRNFDKDIYES